MSKKFDATLILPCYNETEHFDESVKRIFKVLKKDYNRNWEVIFIDDKSTDSTAEKIKKLLQNNNANSEKLYSNQSRISIKAFFHHQNQGRGATVAHGIKESCGKIVGYIDIDCEIDPHYIPIFVKKIGKGFDVVSACRIYKFNYLNVLRYIISRLYPLIQQRVMRNSFPDTEAGYKFFRRKNIMSILKSVKSNHWFWDTEIMVRAMNAGLSITFIPTVFFRRRDKTSTVKLFPDILDYIKNLWRLRRQLAV